MNSWPSHDDEQSYEQSTQRETFALLHEIRRGVRTIMFGILVLMLAHLVKAVT